MKQWVIAGNTPLEAVIDFIRHQLTTVEIHELQKSHLPRLRVEAVNDQYRTPLYPALPPTVAVEPRELRASVLGAVESEGEMD